MKFERSHILIGVIVIIGAIILFYKISNKPIHNDGVVQDTAGKAVDIDNVNDLIDNLNAAEIKEHPIEAATEGADGATLSKLRWKNEAKGKYVDSSYAKGTRGNNGPAEWDNYYNEQSELIDKSYIQNNDSFLPLDETSGNLAGYSGKGQSKMSPEDLFKVDKLLPQEVNNDWFEVMPEPIKVKNRHLVNVTRPVGVNTIGSSHKNASYDLRSAPPCPKFNTGPWNMSSIEPDISVKGLN